MSLSQRKLNILVLHQMGLPKNRRKAVTDLEYMFPINAPEHNYIVHDCDLDLPNFVKIFRFDAIILGPTFLCNRYSQSKYKKTLRKFDFVKDSKAYKIAMPQDDYDCGRILDDWMVSWKVNLLLTVIAKHEKILYPKFINSGKELKLGYTGYISNELVSKWSNPRSFDQREIDISYRASKLPANFGELGLIKSEIGERFTKALKQYRNNLKLDISVDPKDMMPGEKWHNFLENSKFCLVSNSGSSLFDPYGQYRKSIRKFIVKNPNSSFQAIKENCFLGQDYKYEMTAISPRNIEAALSKTVQIAVPGDYSGIFKKYEHYIPLNSDCSNIREVLDLMNNRTYVKQVQKNAKDNILNKKFLYYANHVSDLLLNIRIHSASFHTDFCRQEQIFNQVLKRYKIFLKENLDSYWKKEEFLTNIKKSLKTTYIGKLLKKIVYASNID